MVKPALQGELLIKIGLVLRSKSYWARLFALGVPGVFVAWIVTPVVLISTYVFGQKYSKSLVGHSIWSSPPT